MSGPDEYPFRAVDDARVLLEAMVTHGWSEVRVVSSGTEISLSRSEAFAGLPAEAGGGGESPVAMATRTITAPHCATLVWMAAQGVGVAAGEAVAILSVLGEESALLAICDSTVIRQCAAPGSLLQFGEPVILLSEG